MKIQHPVNTYKNIKKENSLNYTIKTNVASPVSFQGAAEVKTTNAITRFFKDTVEKNIARGLVWIMESKPAQKAFKSSEDNQARKILLNKEIKELNNRIDTFNKSLSDKSKTLKNVKEIPDRLLAHLIVFGSTLLSGFYVLKTLNNKNMDKDKRRTLAINQGLVWGVSTAMAYTFDSWARKQFNTKILDKFKAVNKTMPKEKLDGLTKGMEKARTIIIVDMVYRFIAPVLVTPLANKIGNRLNNNK